MVGVGGWFSWGFGFAGVVGFCLLYVGLCLMSADSVISCELV